MSHKRSAAIAWVLLATMLAACSLPGRSGGASTPGPDARVNTAAAKTVAALGTEIAAGEHPTLVGPATATLTPAPSPTFTLTTTPQPKVSATPSSGEPCNQASFVGDVTIPDGSTLPPNSTFVKTWAIKNTGSCAWDGSYTIVFADRGTAMSGPAETPLVTGGEIRPGEVAHVSVTLRAPNDPGDYEGFWQLRSGDQQNFGTGKGGGAPFFVKIHVDDSYSFAALACSAKWSSGAGDLPCPGEAGDGKGYVLAQENLRLEDNQEREGPGLLVAPQPVAGGYIVGRYPAVIVPDQADFRAVLSCQPGADGCYVRFKVTYRIEGGEEQVLGEWNEGYEGGVTQAVKDLDMAAGKATAFSLYVYVNGAPDQARAIWFNPIITR